MFKEALLGTHQNFTEGSLNRAIVLLAIPMILEMVMEPLFGYRDVFFVSQLGSMPWRRSASPNRYPLLFRGGHRAQYRDHVFVARRTGE